MAKDFDNRARRLNVNLRQSVGAARNLSFAAGELSGKLGGAVNAAGALAENIARASRNARIAAGATGIGAIVALIGTAVALTIGWKEKTKQVADQVREIRNETAQLNAQAANDKRLEKELQIQGAMEGELAAAKKLDSFLRKFPELQEQIRRKAQAARNAATADIGRAFQEQQFDTFLDRAASEAALQGPLQAARQQATEKRLRAINQVDQAGVFSPEQRAQRLENINAAFDAELALIEREAIKPFGDQLGRSLAGAISDGIVTAMSSGSIADGFRALTGAILIGLGEMVQEIGVQGLLAANLMLKLVSALRAFAPEGAIGPAFALIALGGFLKGLGSSMGGRGGGGGGGRGGGGSGGGGGFAIPPTVFVGTISPVAAPTGSGHVNINNPVFIGARDPSVQRELLELMKYAGQRGGV